MKITEKIKVIVRLLHTSVLCFCLWSMGPISFAQSDALDQLDNLTKDEQEALKNLEVSDSLKNAANNFAENSKPEFTETDRKALKLLGYSDQEIDQLSLASLADKDEQEKFKNRLNNYADNKSKELDEGVMGSLVPGLGSSVLGLAFASLLGVVVGVRCYNQPSALAFAGTSAAWVGLEMMIWKGYQIRMDDIETLQNATKIPRKVEAKIKKVTDIIERLESEFKKQNPQNAGDFEAFLADNKDAVDELKVIAEEIRGYLKTAKDRQFGALRSIQESIALAAETSKKKSRNAKVAAIGYTAAAGLAAAEAFNILGAGGQCAGVDYGTTLAPRGIHYAVIGLLAKLVVHNSLAGFASVGDLDKIGIPVGGGLAAAYLGFKQTFADAIYRAAPTRGVVFLAMAGIAFLAHKKLAEAAVFLQKQADEMDIFVTAIEDKLSKLKATFPDGAELIRELKEELLPEVEEIINGLSDKEEELKELAASEAEKLAQDKIGELGLSEKELEEQVKSQIKDESKFDQNSIAKEIRSVDPNIMARLPTDDFNLPTTSWQRIEDFLISPAYAAKRGFKNKTPVSCVVRTKGYVALNDSCSCVSSKKCFKSRFPSKIKLKKSNEFANFSYKLGGLVSKGSDYITHGRPDKGIRLFSKAGSLYSKMDLNTRKLLSKKLGKRVDHKMTARLMAKGFNSLRPGLPDYFRGQGKQQGHTMNPRLSNNLVKSKTRSLMSARDQRSALRASLRNKLALAKRLGNESLNDYQVEEARAATSAGDDGYNYSKESIILDSSKDLFELIKKRYLIIQSQGRLAL